MFNQRTRHCACMNNASTIEDESMMESNCYNSSVLSCNSDYMNCCECGFDEEPNMFPSNPMYGQSYVPYQYMEKTFKPCAGLKMGTIFPELVSPYYPCQSMEEIAYIRASNKIGEECNKCS